MAVAFGVRVQTTTQDYIAPYMVDTVLRESVLAKDILSKAKEWMGELMKFPLKYAKNLTGTSFSGYDTLPVNATNNRVNLSYSPAKYSISVSLPMDEITVNNTDEKILDLTRIEMTSAAHDMVDDLGTIFYSDGTANSSKDPLGLAAIVDAGTNVATIGGLSRTTYPTLQSTVTASGGTISLAKMATLYSNVSDGSIAPTEGYCDHTVWNLIETLFSPEERIVKSMSDIKGGLILGGGATAIYWKGFPIFADRKATAETLFFVNNRHFQFYGRPFYKYPAIKFRMPEIKGISTPIDGLGFSWSDWMESPNNAAIVGRVYLFGDLLTDNPRRHGRLTGITRT